MLRSLSAVMLLLAASSALASKCPTSANSDRLYAEVISRGHMELELVVVQKGSPNSNFQVKAVGGLDANISELSCDMPGVSLNQVHPTIFTAYVGGGNNLFYGNFKVCEFYLGRLIHEVNVCNSETGD